jgi:hypothetical protein
MLPKGSRTANDNLAANLDIIEWAQLVLGVAVGLQSIGSHGQQAEKKKIKLWEKQLGMFRFAEPLPEILVQDAKLFHILLRIPPRLD